MARNELKAKIRLEGDASGADKAIKKTEGGFKRLGNFLKNNMLKITAAVAAGFFALSKAFGAVTSAAQQQEDAVRALDAALIPLGANAAGVSKALQEQAAALQQVTKFGDETIIRGQALIASFTKNEEEIKGATQAALDLSAAVGIDLNAAFLLMGKAAKGETSTLTRYGIILEEGIPATEKFAAAIKTVNDQFGGRAAEAAKSYSGITQQVGNAFGDLVEKIGFAITENESLVVALTKVRDVLTTGGLVDAVGRFAKGLSDAVTTSVDFVRGSGEIVRSLKEQDSILGGLIEHRQREIEVLTEAVRLYFSGVDAIGQYIVVRGEQVRAEDQAADAAKALADRIQEVEDAEHKAFLSGEAWGDTLKEIKLTEEQLIEVEKKHAAALAQVADAQQAVVSQTTALGEVTSVQLANQISAISLELELQKTVLDETGVEYKRLEEVARVKIESLQERIENLRRGLGDMKMPAMRLAISVTT
jgi:hypothetical protein